MGCCEAQYRKSQSFFFSRPDKAFFSFKDVVPIKHHHYLKEYDFEKNLPSTKERTSNISDIDGDIRNPLNQE
jgi:hypothetical protein